MLLFPDGTDTGGIDYASSIYAAPVATAPVSQPVVLLAPDLPPRQPMSQPAIIPTFPGAGTIVSTGAPGVVVPPPLPPSVPVPVSTPPMGCGSCGAPPIVAVPRAPSPVGTITAANVLPTNAADLQAMAKQWPWWVWLVLAVVVLLVLRGLFK